MSGTAAFDASGIYDVESSLGQINASQEIQMPNPIISTSDIPIYNGGEIELSEKFQKYFRDLDPAYELRSEYFGDLEFDFAEWGMPKSADDEQFYIAMRWPYNPIESREKLGDITSLSQSQKNEALKKFLKMYNLNEADLAGTTGDYKKRKVLVYNPEKRVAVVCTPAYFLWGEQELDDSDGLAAIVSPDAAYFLNLLIDDKGRIVSPLENLGLTNGGSYNDDLVWKEMAMSEMSLKKCMFTFVPDTTPVGVVTSTYNPANRFKDSGKNGIFGPDTFLIGFGAFKVTEGNLPELLPALASSRPDQIPAGVTADRAEQMLNNGIRTTTSYTFDSDIIKEKKSIDWQMEWSKGGNWVNYFDYIQPVNGENKIQELSQDSLFKRLEEDKKNGIREEFTSVYDPLDNISVIAAGFYDEKFDNTVKVIAGGGRKIVEAQQIWDQFRFGYHNYEPVKAIFQKYYNLDPDSDVESEDPLFKFITGKDRIVFEDFGASKDNLEFNTLLGPDWVTSINQAASVTSAVEIAVEEYIDGGVNELDENNKPIIDKGQGIIDIYNFLLQKKLTSLKSLVKNHFEVYKYKDTELDDADTKESEDEALELLKAIKTPKQLYLLLVGIFRQKLWADPYARAWLVLRPDKKRYSATGAAHLAIVGTAMVPGVRYYGCGSPCGVRLTW